MSPDDTIPCTSIPPSPEDREERGKVAYAAYANSLSHEGFKEETWEELADYDREAWLCAADAAYRHVIITKE